LTFLLQILRAVMDSANSNLLVALPWKPVNDAHVFIKWRITPLKTTSLFRRSTKLGDKNSPKRGVNSTSQITVQVQQPRHDSWRKGSLPRCNEHECGVRQSRDVPFSRRLIPTNNIITRYCCIDPALQNKSRETYQWDPNILAGPQKVERYFIENRGEWMSTTQIILLKPP